MQEQASNRFKLHGSRALVVSVDGKGTAKTVSGEVQGDERKRTTDEVSKTSNDDVETGRLTLLQDKSRGEPAYCLGGVRRTVGTSLIRALLWNVGTCRSDDKGEIQSGRPMRMRVPMRSTGADQLVVMLKSL